MDPNFNFKSVKATARRQPLASPQRPDPLGSHELDWEYQGRYLELEERRLAQGAQQKRAARNRKNSWRTGAGLRSRGGARKDDATSWETAVPLPRPGSEQPYRFRYPRPANGGRADQRL
jgi:hypothetical protein